MRTSPTPRRLLALTALATISLTACGGDVAGDDLADLPPADQGADDDADGAAGGTTMRVFTVPEAKRAEAEGSILVSGLLIDEGDGWQLCEVSLESFPPQCGGETLQVEGLDESDYPIEEASGVRWVDGATVVGEVDGGTITVTGSPASS